jgi:predicted metal-dependent phosphoesterase TrpH
MHSTYSDGKWTIPELVDEYGRRGFGVIAITDHVTNSDTLLGRAARVIRWTLTPQSFPEYLDVIRAEGERALRQYGMLVIPGFELTRNDLSNHRSAHIVALGCEEFFWADGDAKGWARRIRDSGGVSIAAHPVYLGHPGKQTYHLWRRRRELASEIDLWEVASGRHLFDDVIASGLPMVASSDLHRPDHITSWKTVLRCERRQEAVLDALRRQEVRFQYYADAPTGSPSSREAA